MQMFWTLLLAVSTLQCGFCANCTVKYETKLIAVKSSCVTIRCWYSCPMEYQVRATIWTALHRGTSERESFVYHPQRDLIDPLYRERAQYLGDLNHDCSLHIIDLSYQDDASFRFTVLTDMGSFSTQEEVYVDFFRNFFYRPGLCNLHIISPQEIQEGKEAVWICSSRRCRYRSAPQWYDSNGEIITKGTVMHDSGQNISLSITPTWLDHRRYIECRIYEDPLRDNCFLPSKTQIQVNHTPKGIHVNLLSESINGMKLGDTVSMSCKVNSSNPLVSQYSWYKDGNEIHNQSEANLRIENLTATDWGNYSCVARNVVGPSLSSPPIRISANAGYLGDDQGLTRSNSAHWIGILVGIVVVMAVSIAAALPMWRYLKNKRKDKSTSSTEVQLKSKRDGGESIYENIDNVYAALDQSQTSSVYDCLGRED